MQGQSPASAQSPDLASLLGVASSHAMDTAAAPNTAPTHIRTHAETMLNTLQGPLSAVGFPCCHGIDNTQL